MTKPVVSQPRKYLIRMMVCPEHKFTAAGKIDEQPVANCAVYSDGTYYCFGCGARGKV